MANADGFPNADPCAEAPKAEGCDGFGEPKTLGLFANWANPPPPPPELVPKPVVVVVGVADWPNAAGWPKVEVPNALGLGVTPNADWVWLAGGSGVLGEAV